MVRYLSFTGLYYYVLLCIILLYNLWYYWNDQTVMESGRRRDAQEE